MADQPAPPAPTPTVYHVGTMPDGRAILSEAGGLPVDDTVVWAADAPGARMTVVEMEDANPLPDGQMIAWASRPEPYDPAAAKPETAPASNPAKEPPAAAKMAAVTIDGEPPTGAMIALVPEDPETIADPDGDPADALHVTLKWLGPAEYWDDEQRRAVEDIVARWANGHTGSYKATVGGAGRLGKEDAAVLFLDIDDLHESRSKLSAALYDAVGPDSEDTHSGFIPHLTTGYGTEPRYDLMGEPVWFDSVSVHWGPEVSAYPLNSDVAYIAALGEDPEMPPPGEVEDQVDELSEVEVDRMSDLVDEAEEKVGNLEGLVAELVMAQLDDELFLDDPQGDRIPKVASLQDADMTGYRRALDGFRRVSSRIAALTDDLPDDLAGRVEAVMERLEALEGSVAQMMLAEVDEMEMPELPPGSGTFVDETNPHRPGHEDDKDDPVGDDSDDDDDAGDDDDPDDDKNEDENDDGPPWASKKRKRKGGK